MPDWADLFALQAPLLETLIRGTVVFLLLFVLMRIGHKRASGALSLTDLLIVILVAQAVQAGLVGDAVGISDGLILAATILFWSTLVDVVAYRVPALRPLLKSSPTALIRDGRIDQRALRREFLQEEELLAQLRLHGVQDPNDVARAYLEANGMVSVLRRDGGANERPPRPPTVG